VRRHSPSLGTDSVQLGAVDQAEGLLCVLKEEVLQTQTSEGAVSFASAIRQLGRDGRGG
jgi:hypothetical protein